MSFEHGLDRGRDIHVLLFEHALGTARRQPEQRVEAPIRHRQARAVVEIVEIEPERPVVLDVDEVIEDELDMVRSAVGREPHQLVFARIDLEAGVVGEGRIEQAEAVREVDFLVNGKLVLLADGDRRRGPLAHAVERENQRALERRWIEGRRRVAQMMLAEGQPVVPVELRRHLLKFVRKQRFLEKFFAQPQRQRHAERREAARRHRQIGFRAGART